MRMNEVQAVVMGRTDWYRRLFDDCKNDPNIVVGEEFFYNSKGSFLTSLFYRLAFSRRLPPFWEDNCLSRYYINKICKNLRKHCKNNTVIILNRACPFAHNEYFLKKIKRMNNNFKLVYWFTEIVNNVLLSQNNILDICDKYYDLTITYDLDDVKRYGFEYIETPYSYNKNVEESVEFDISYVGSAKLETDRSRFDKIINVYESAVKHGLKVEFYINGVPDTLKKYDDKIHYNILLSYTDVIKIVCKSRAILEVPQEGERGTTLRLFEAISYQKKLLTTSSITAMHPLFNNKYMRVLSQSVHGDFEIDENFILSNEEIFYNPKDIDELSPINFINKIKKLLFNVSF